MTAVKRFEKKELRNRCRDYLQEKVKKKNIFKDFISLQMF